MNRTKSSLIAFLGVCSALMFGFLVLETQVLSGILPVTPCYLSLPLAVTLSIYGRNFKGGFVGGTIFGLCSFALSFIFGQAWFYNPLISILPRVIFGLTATLTYMGLSKATCNSKNVFVKNTLPCAVAGVVGAVTNTILVVSGFFIFGWQNLQQALVTILSFNALIEIICCAILVPALVKTTRKFYKLDRQNQAISENNTDINQGEGEQE